MISINIDLIAAYSTRFMVVTNTARFLDVNLIFLKPSLRALVQLFHPQIR